MPTATRPSSPASCRISPSVRQAEEALIDAERKWRNILVNTPQLGIARDPQGKITFANRHFLTLTGWLEGEVLGRDWFGMFVPEELRAKVRHMFDAATTDEDTTGFTNYEGVVVTRAGEVRSIAWSNVITRDADGRMVDVTSLGVDLTERKRAEVDRESILAQFREQVRRIEGILDAVPEGVLLIESDGLVLLANPAAEDDLAVLAGVRPGGVIHHLGDRPLAEFLTSPPTQGLWHEAHAGERIYDVIAHPVTNGVEPERYVLVFSDTTRAREMQTELLQQERLAAVGQLAAGIAHDFNNVLAVIVLYAQMDAALPDLPDRLYAHLKTIGDEATHASHLIQQILDFSRRKVSEPSPLDLVPLLQERVRLLGFTLPESIKIEYIYPPGEVLVEADPTRMQQMIVNLAVNARDAMPEGGVLSLTLEMIEVAHHALAVARRRAGDVGQSDRRRYRHRDLSRGPGAPLRALLHHQGTGQRHRTGPRPGLWHRQAARRPDRCGVRSRPRHHLHHLPARSRARHPSTPCLSRRQPYLKATEN